jgi:hypothetical protein
MLNQSGGMALRMNSGTAKRGKYWIMLHEPGTADILFFPRSWMFSVFNGPRPECPVWIETKQPKGHTNPEQVEAQAQFKATVEALGHRYIRATTIDEGLEALR